MFRFLVAVLLLCAALSLSFACGGGAVDEEGIGVGRTVELAWNPPTTNADGTPLAGLAGYIIHYGPSPGTYVHSIDVGNVTECAVALPFGTWYLAVTAYNVQRGEGPYSNEIVVVINGSEALSRNASPIHLPFGGPPASLGGDAFPLAAVSLPAAGAPSRLTAS
jgi:hypothetical protein